MDEYNKAKRAKPLVDLHRKELKVLVQIGQIINVDGDRNSFESIIKKTVALYNSLA